MYIKGNMLYAEVYKYLRHKSGRLVALSISGNADDFEEVDMDSPIEVVVKDTLVTWNKGLLACSPGEMTYEAVKTKIIKSRYSNDDQLAIILNKDASEEDAMYYQKMQEWREFAAYIAGSVNY